MNGRNQLRKQNKDEEFGNLTLLKKTIGGIINKNDIKEDYIENHGKKKWAITRGLKFTVTAIVPTIITRLSVNISVPCAILPMAASTRLGLVFKCCQVFQPSPITCDQSNSRHDKHFHVFQEGHACTKTGMIVVGVFEQHAATFQQVYAAAVMVVDCVPGSRKLDDSGGELVSQIMG